MKKITLFLVCIMLFGGYLFAGGSAEDVAIEDQAVVEKIGGQPIRHNQDVVLEDNWWTSWAFYENEIEFTMSAPTTGWVSIGFNPSSRMRDAAYVIGYVAQGSVFIREDYGTGTTSHRPDVQLGGTEDVVVIAGSEEGGVTSITFRLPLDSQDEYDVVFVKGETYRMLFAYGPQNGDNFTSVHRARRALDVVLQ